MGGFLLGIILIYILTQVIAMNKSSVLNPDMEEVKEHIDKAAEYRERLQQLDNMITDFEILTDPTREICKNLTFSYQSRGGENTEVSMLMSGNYTTVLLLEMLENERDEVAEKLLDETEKIPKRQRQLPRVKSIVTVKKPYD